MNPSTGAIGWFENKDDAIHAGHTVPVPKNELPEVLKMSRSERRKWAKERGEFKKKRLF